MVEKHLQALSSIWLSSWADDNAKMTDSAATTHGLLVYIALALGTGKLRTIRLSLGYHCRSASFWLSQVSHIPSVLLNIAALMSSTFGSIRASLDLHHPLVSALMSAPLLFFEETPLGRILSRIAGVGGDV